jgi:hypothetical protein
VAKSIPAVDEVAALTAKLKHAKGESLTKKETTLVNQYDSRNFQVAMESFLGSVPKGIYCDLAGRQNKVVDEFGRRYDVPCDGPVINLHAVISTLHSRVSELAAVARPHLDGDEAELEKEKLKQEIGKLQRQSAILQIDIEKHMDQLVEKSSLNAGMEWLSARLRTLGSQVHRVAGDEALECVNEFLDALATELETGGAIHF